MRSAFLLLGVLAIVSGCDAPGYKKLHDRHAQLWEEHQALQEEHARLRKETKVLLSQTVKDRKLTGLRPFSVGEEHEVGQDYVHKIRGLRDGKQLTVQVVFDTIRFSGTKPSYEVYFHDTSGAVMGRCGKKAGFLGKKISSDYGEDALTAELSSPLNPAFYSVTIR